MNEGVFQFALLLKSTSHRMKPRFIDWRSFESQDAFPIMDHHILQVEDLNNWRHRLLFNLFYFLFLQIALISAGIAKLSNFWFGPSAIRLSIHEGFPYKQVLTGECTNFWIRWAPYADSLNLRWMWSVRHWLWFWISGLFSYPSISKILGLDTRFCDMLTNSKYIVIRLLSFV